MKAREDDPIAALPFVADRPPEKPGNPRCFWMVQSTGDSEQDQALGQECALAFVLYEAAQDHNLRACILPSIVADMPRELTEIEIDFLTIVGIAASEGIYQAERVVTHWRRCRDARRVRRRGPRKVKRENAA